LWLHSLKVAQLLRSAACLHTNQSRSYLNHLVVLCSLALYSVPLYTWSFSPGKIWIWVNSVTLLIGHKALCSRYTSLGPYFFKLTIPIRCTCYFLVIRRTILTTSILLIRNGISNERIT